MIHPLLQLIATKPQLLGDHVEAYAELVSAEVSNTSKRWISRAVLWAASAFLIGLFIAFAGVALMLWAVVPTDAMNIPWLLLVVPVVPLAAGTACILLAKSHPQQNAFQTVKEQISADMAMLREVSAAT
jgi:uncharacterized membrane protein YqjE